MSPDAGGAERTRAFAKRLGAGLAIVDKRRPKPNEAHVMHVIGDIEGKICIMMDDMSDTSGTLTGGATALMEKGAKEVHAYVTHPVLSGPALERIKGSALSSLVVTNTISLKPAARACDKIRVVSVASLLASAIKRCHTGDSVADLFV